MNVVFAPAISILTRLPNVYKVVILFVVSMIPTAILGYMTIATVSEPGMKTGLYVIAGAAILMFLYFCSK